MGTFAETAIVDYHLLFANQRKQTSVSVSVCSKQMKIAIFIFRLEQTKRSCSLLLVPFSINSYIETAAYIYIHIYTADSVYIYREWNYIYIYMMPFQTEDGKMEA
jgi:hypothetical protein